MNPSAVTGHGCSLATLGKASLSASQFNTFSNVCPRCKLSAQTLSVSHLSP